MLAMPDSGGDTLFANSVEAYNRLSPAMKEKIGRIACLAFIS